MTFSGRITRMPRPFAMGPEDRLDLAGLDGAAADLAARVAGCSPYLADLLRREGGWLPAALDDLSTLPAEWDLDPCHPDLASQLRRAKRRVALVTALADLGGVWSLEAVTRTLSDFADAAAGLAIRSALAQLVPRGKIPGLDMDALDDAGGLAIFAMGKMGAGELNYSSDIDLICLFDETRYDPEDYAEVRTGFSRAVRMMRTMLSDVTAEGYVFRTDLRLRPDPAVTPVALSMGAAERYYESVGRTWERAAWIKARPAAGDLAAGAAFQKQIAPFVWRKHLDFAAIQDAHDMRLAIRDAKGLHGPITLTGHDMKLGRGGIREIEFFTQTRQLIAGGRDETLRVRGTVDGLGRLADAGWVEDEIAGDLADHYRYHRTVEHRLQMMRDARTHHLPSNGEDFARLAAMMDRDVEELQAELSRRLEAVHAQTDAFFAPDVQRTEESSSASVIIDRDRAARWLNFPAFRSTRAQELFERIRPGIEERLAAAAEPEDALAAFEGFLAGLPAGVQLFALFEANPQLVDLLLDVLTTAPPLAEHLARNSEVLDAVIGGDFFTPWPGDAGLTAQLCKVLGALDDYERKLDAARRWQKEWHFRVGVHHLRGLTAAEEASRQYADIARSVLTALWPEVVAQFALRHGAEPGRGAVLLGMGSLGSGRLTPTSDLDVIVIYDPLDETESVGPKPLETRQYFARLSKALIAALSAQTAEGRLYEVDMRLRPSGNQGPVATSWGAFQSYQNRDAWLWEHMALTQASCIAGAPDLARDVAAFLPGILGRPRNTGDVLGAVAEMRARIAAARGDQTVWAVKTRAGGLQDIALLAQGGALLGTGVDARDIPEATRALASRGICPADAADALARTYQMAARVQIALRLVSAPDALVGTLGHGAQATLLRALPAETIAEAEEILTRAFAAADHVISQALPREDADADGRN